MEIREPIRKVAIVGRGNVAYHLCRAFGDTVEVVQINSRSELKIEDDVSMIVIAVADSAIQDVAAGLPSSGALVVHTSGSVGIDILREYHDRCGVLYTLQTFSKAKDLDYSKIPFFIEANYPEDLRNLMDFAAKISSLVTAADSGQRRQIHLSAVFACNFVNRMYDIAWKLMKDSNLPPEFLQPLIEETASKIRDLTPVEAQTGPARRGDTAVVDRHLGLLTSYPEYKEIYRIISEGIMNENIKDCSPGVTVQ